MTPGKIATINRQLERATPQEQREFLYYLLGWLETAEGQGNIHPNTVTGIECAAKSTVNRHAQPQETSR